MKMLSQVVKALLDNGAHRATKFIAPNLVLRATRRHYWCDKGWPKRNPIEIVVHLGRPNESDQADAQV